jgi:hypothetical protein
MDAHFCSLMNAGHEVADGFHLPSSQRQMKKINIFAIFASLAKRVVNIAWKRWKKN